MSRTSWQTFMRRVKYTRSMLSSGVSELATYFASLEINIRHNLLWTGV